MSQYKASVYSYSVNNNTETCSAAILLNNQKLGMTHDSKNHTTTLFSDLLHNTITESGAVAQTADQLTPDEVESYLPGLLGVITPLFTNLKGDHAAAKHEKWVILPSGDASPSQ